MNCIFSSDIHGNKNKYEKLFKIILKEKPDAVFLGGDLLPLKLKEDTKMEQYINKFLIGEIKKIKDTVSKKIEFFLILGNDDPRIYEKLFMEADKKGEIEYIHNKKDKWNDFFVIGYSYVPPTPFKLKDWERYDVSRHVDVGAISPEEGFRTVDISQDEKKFSTIKEDLEILSKNTDMKKTIFLFHAPPYKSYLDRADLEGKKIDHVPLDIHVGSIAIKRFIKKNAPFLTLHGHIHESTRLTGNWKQKFGKTFSFNASHDGSELSVVRFDTDNLEKASRELI